MPGRGIHNKYFKGTKLSCTLSLTLNLFYVQSWYLIPVGPTIRYDDDLKLKGKKLRSKFSYFII